MRLSANLTWAWAVAACALLAAAPALAGDRDQVRGPGFQGGGGSTTAQDRLELVARQRITAAFGSDNPTSSETQSRCGCNRDPANGQAARAGF